MGAPLLGVAHARLVIAGVGSDVGKTTVSTGIMGALARRGLRVQAFKVGPDYIDPGYHRLATGAPSYNLDTWLMGERGVVSTFSWATAHADIGVVEGVMGLFDGSSPTDDSQSTAEVARLLAAPTVLVVDVSGVGRSAAAQVLGYMSMARGFNVSGVILNRVGSDGHAELCRRAIEHHAGVPVVGAIKNTENLRVPSRHLGLHMAHEGVEQQVKQMVDVVESSVDLDAVLRIASEALPLPALTGCEEPATGGGRVRVGVALDDAFSFYYEDNFRALRASGAQLIFFSPSGQSELPDVDALYIGGGYPQLRAEALEANGSMMASIKAIVEDGVPVYAECGGLMYLGRSLIDLEGRAHRMVGVFDLDTALTKRLTIGYTQLESVRDSIVAPSGATLRGHEFHYSEATDVSSDSRFAYRVRLGRGIVDMMDGCMNHNALGSYSHLHFAGAVDAPKRLIQYAERWKHR